MEVQYYIIRQFSWVRWSYFLSFRALEYKTLDMSKWFLKRETEGFIATPSLFIFGRRRLVPPSGSAEMWDRTCCLSSSNRFGTNRWNHFCPHIIEEKLTWNYMTRIGLKSTVTVHNQPGFLNFASGSVVDYDFFSWLSMVGCYNNIWMQKWFWVSLLK